MPHPPLLGPTRSGYARQWLIAFLSMPKAQPRWQYAITVLVIAFTTLIWFSLQHSVTSLPFLLYTLAVFLVALTFGKNSAFLAVGASVIALIVLFADPLFEFAVESADDLLALVLFAFIGCGIALLTDALRTMLEALQSTLDQLAAADREKDILLREVHHRIRNDLQMIVMQLHLAKGQRDNLAEALDRTIERVSIISRVYGRLQRHEGTRIVEAASFIRQLVEDLQLTHVDTRPIIVRTHVEPAKLDISVTLALGIIINELLTNALKYAFPEHRAGQIDVTFRRQGEEYALVIQDNGVGLANGPPQGTGLGRQIIQQFAEQLDGRFEVQSEGHGLQATLIFPTRAHPGA